MNFPDYETYRKLYARFYEGELGSFFARSGLIADKSVMDICGGGGELSSYAIRRGAAFCVIVDKCAAMRSPATNFSRIAFIERDIVEYLDAADFTFLKFDIAVCRQGINYWFKKINPLKLARAIKPNGWFVFNTFNQKPKSISIRRYALNNVKYTEINHCSRNNIVYHVQIADRMRPHFTYFDWISKKEFVQKLEPYFHLVENRRGCSSMWYCQKKI